MSLKTLLGDKYKEGMTAEEMAEALEKIEMPNMSEYVTKKTADKYASEAAEYKRKLREKQTEEEAKAAEKADEDAQKEARLQELEKKVKVSEQAKSYLKAGYDEAMATECAEAWVNGDVDTVLKNQTKFLDIQKKKIVAEAMKQTPPPPAGGGGIPPAQKKISEMSLAEIQKFATENPEEFAKLTKQ